jgi:Zn-dependent M28 family amino/carboxypeptidase
MRSHRVNIMTSQAPHLNIDKRRFVPWLCCLALAACAKDAPPPEHPTPSPSPEPAAASAPAAPYSPEAARAAEQITGEFIRGHIAKLSEDAFEGRGPGTPGDQGARNYLIEQLKALELSPGNGDQWEQPFDIVGITSEMPKRWTFKQGKKELGLNYFDQYIGASGVQAAKSTVANAEVVFVGYGIEAPEYQWDDFKGQDLKGKVLLMLNNDPDWDPALFAGNTRLYYGRWTYKYESAARHGAAGAIIIHTTPSAGYPFSVVQSSWGGEQFELPAEDEPRIALQAWVTEAAAQDLVKLAGKDLGALVESAKSRDFKPVQLGVTTSISFANKLKRGRTANVFATLPGSDPNLKSEYVIYTAHHDHLGVGKPNDKGDKIYNGALDNATGCGEVLAIARAFKALPKPPARSVMFLFVAAEEQGLLGSSYFAAHPTMPGGKIAANINYDGGNIWGRTKDVTFVGRGKSSLDSIVDALATSQGRRVKPDQFPDRGHFYRSDQFSFAHIGVPALYLDTGLEFVDRPADWGKQQIEAFEEHDYHQPSDELRDSWSFDGMIEDVKLGFWAGENIASAPQMPSWTAGDEFEATRKAAVAAAQ